MEIQTALIERRTIHQFSNEPVPQILIDQALAAALYAPNHKNTRPLRFYQVGIKTREKLAELYLSLKQEKKPLSEPVIQALKRKFLNPSHLIIICQIRCEDALQMKEDYATVAAAAQNFFLSLWGNNIGSKWSTGAISRDLRTYKILAIDPKEESIEGFLWAGKAEHVPSAPPRPRLEDVFWKKF